MNINELTGAIHAILFASGEEISLARLCEACGADKKTVRGVLANLKDKFQQEGCGVELCDFGDSYQLCSKAQFAPYVKKALDIKRNVPLSQAAFEVLSIIAYNQPVTKSFVEQIRGVDSSSIVNSLCEKGLIQEAGRLELPGRPIAYETTSNFLRCFGISSLNELPELPREASSAAQEEDAPQPQQA